MPDLDVLRSLGDQLVPPPLETLRTTARRRDLRTRVVSVAASVATVAVVTAVAVLLRPDEGADPRPVGPVETEKPPIRPLTYADGTTIHYGGESVDAGGRVVELDLTDQGVAFRTAEGQIGFTDGSTVHALSQLGEPGPVHEGGDDRPLFVHDGWMVSAHTGSLMAWFEFPRPGQPHVVAYDTSSGEVLGRDQVSLDDGGAVPAFVSDRYVYWYDEPDPGLTGHESSLVRYDPGNGQVPVSQTEAQEDLLGDGPERTVLIRGEMGGTIWVTDGTDRNFGIEGGRVFPMGAGDMVARDGLTGQRLEFDAPPGYPRQVAAYLTQWIDDDTIVLLSATARGDDLIECRVSSGGCEVVLSGPGSVVAPELG